MPETCDVVVVGAGPTGLMAAGLLARFGVRVRIFDKSPGPAKESRAMVVQARTLELALFMGCADAFLDRGFVVGGIDLVIDGKPALALTFDDVGPADTPYGFSLMIPQSETEAILVADLKAHGVEVEYGATVTAFTQDENGVTVQVDPGEGGGVHCAFLIGADGAHSLVRKALDLRFEGAAYPQDFLLADCAVTWPLRYDRLSLFLHDQLFAAYFPTKGDKRGRVIAVDPRQDEAATSRDSQGAHDAPLATVEAVMRDATQTEVALSDPTWTARYRVHHRGVDRYRTGRVFVAGDAAHIHSPAGGQGMNTGLQDAANLAWKLAAVVKGKSSPALLDSYHDERWPVGQKVLKRTDRMFSAMVTKSRLVAGMRNLAVPSLGRLLMGSATVQARAFRFVSELGIRYGTGRFVADHLSAEAPARLRRGFRAGYRAPDARINRTTSVFDLLKADAFHLLALSATPLDEAGIADLSRALGARPADIAGLPCRRTLVARSLLGRDPRLMQAETGEIFTRYGLGPDAPQGLFLIRPDGHVAFRSDRLDFGALDTFVRGFSPAG